MTDTVPPGDHAVEVEERQEDKDDMDDMDDMDDSAGDSSGWFFRVPLVFLSVIVLMGLKRIWWSVLVMLMLLRDFGRSDLGTVLVCCCGFF